MKCKFFAIAMHIQNRIYGQYYYAETLLDTNYTTVYVYHEQEAYIFIATLFLPDTFIAIRNIVRGNLSMASVF